MIRAVIFDLDGTLVQTEILKARSYARAAVQLAPDRLGEEAVVAAFREVVGKPRREVAEYLIEKFQLEREAARRQQEMGVWAPWQVLVQIRLDIYQRMLSDPNLLRAHRCPYNLALLRSVHRKGLATGLATMSHCKQAKQVLRLLEIDPLLDFVATRDDVEHGKPDPEIYLLVAGQLGIAPEHCLVIEDSPAGIQAALNAGMQCLAVTNELTREQVHASGLLPPERIVDDPRNLSRAAERLMAGRN